VRILGVEGELVRARANFLVTEAMSDEDPRVFMVGRYFDVLTRRDGACCSRSASRCATTTTCGAR
jgi:3-phenylpropionate/cinnamic acid dioxygenase small subunit